MNKQPIKLSDHFTYSRLLRFTLPSMIMMIVTSIYGIVDGFFVSNFAGKTDFAAVNFIIPFLIIISSPGFMLGPGGSALVSKCMGEGKNAQARSIFSLLVYAAIVLGVLISAVSFVFLEQIATLMGAEGALLRASVLYGKILVAATPVYILQMMFQSLFIAAEKPKLGLWVTVVSGVTNMILDALLVGISHLGLVGAAVATAISQAVGGLLPLVYFSLPNSSLLRLGKTTFQKDALLKTSANGSSELMSCISMSLVSMLYNIQLLEYAGENGIAAYGAMMYVSMIFYGFFQGYSIGIAPVISFHYGANNHKELRNLKIRSFVIIGSFSIAMITAGILLSVPLSNLFVGYDKTLMDMTIRGMRIYALSFLFMGFAVFFSAFFTALNDGLTSAAISFLRTLVFQIAAVLVLPIIWGLDGIWFSLVVAEIMAVAVALIFLVTKQKKYQY